MVIPGSGVGTPSVMSPKTIVSMPTMNRLKSPSRQHRLDHAAVEAPDDQAFDDRADDTDRERRNHQYRDPDIDMVMDGDGGAIATHHHELAMRKVDDAHHPEHDGEPEADQR